jgi:uncharacterized protein
MDDRAERRLNFQAHNMKVEDAEFLKTVLEDQQKTRPYADFFNWSDKQPKELDVVDCLLQAIHECEGRNWIKEIEPGPDVNFPPDVIGITYENTRVAFEVTELIDKETDADRKLFEDIQTKAEKRDAFYQCVLGELYTLGTIGVSTNFPEAAKWYLKAAEQGVAEAQYNLGSFYENGEGVTMDKTNAVKWYRKAAEQGYDSAQSRLGRCYADGSGVVKDAKEAVKWYQRAAERGNAVAQNNLANCYSKGDGVPQDEVEAVKWYRKAAEQGAAGAQCNLGVRYMGGIGCPQDMSEGIRWIRKAAEQGDGRSEMLLGYGYAEGTGVPQDYIEAYKWFNLSLAQGFDQIINVADSELREQLHENLESELNTLKAEMTPEQIAEGQQLTREFKPRKAPESGTTISKSGVLDSNPAASGSGFFISDDGYLITNYHVVKDAAQVRLVTSAGFIAANVVQVDAANDIALLKADGRFATLPILPSRTAQLGSTVATIGFPDIGLQGFAPKLAKGEIASLSGASDDPRYFQISVPVQPGNSGGALVDERGNVIGIVSAKLDASVALAASGALPENVNYAVKSSLLLSFLESVPNVSAKLKEPNTQDEKFEDVVKSAQGAAVLVLVY